MQCSYVSNYFSRNHSGEYLCVHIETHIFQFCWFQLQALDWKSRIIDLTLNLKCELATAVLFVGSILERFICSQEKGGPRRVRYSFNFNIRTKWPPVLSADSWVDSKIWYGGGHERAWCTDRQAEMKTEGNIAKKTHFKIVGMGEAFEFWKLEDACRRLTGLENLCCDRLLLRDFQARSYQLFLLCTWDIWKCRIIAPHNLGNRYKVLN